MSDRVGKLLRSVAHTAVYSIKGKLLMLFGLLIVVPIALLSILAYRAGSSIVYEHLLLSVDNTMVEMAGIFTHQIASLSTSLTNITTKEALQEFFSRQKYAYSDGEHYQQIKRLELFLFDSKTNSDLDYLRLYLEPQHVFLVDSYYIGRLDTPATEQSIRETIALEGGVRISYTMRSQLNREEESSFQVLSFSKQVVDTFHLRPLPAVLEIGVRTSYFEQVLGEFTKTGYAYFLTDGGYVISRSHSQDTALESVALETFRGHGHTGWFEFHHKGIRYAGGYYPMENTGYALLSIVPMDEFLSPGRNLRNAILLLALITGLVCFAIAYLVAASYSRRLKTIIGQMEAMQRNNFDVKLQIRSRDELGVLEHSFNYMVDKISVLLDQQFEMGLKMKASELTALQAQINPHFLYNTLDLINWMSRDGNDAGVASLVENLADFYKRALSRGQPLIPLRDELLLIQNYVAIQNHRFDDRIRLVIEVDEALLSRSILKLVLQPLVENSILHGIRERPGKTGVIRISTRNTEECLLLSIADDGVGMQPMVLDRLLTSDSGSGYGVRNVHERIQLQYGTQYGLAYISAPGEGTTVYVRLPNNIAANGE